MGMVGSIDQVLRGKHSSLICPNCRSRESIFGTLGIGGDIPNGKLCNAWASLGYAETLLDTSYSSANVPDPSVHKLVNIRACQVLLAASRTSSALFALTNVAPKSARASQQVSNCPFRSTRDCPVMPETVA
jgi:hypothetical protein